MWIKFKESWKMLLKAENSLFVDSFQAEKLIKRDLYEWYAMLPLLAVKENIIWRTRCKRCKRCSKWNLISEVQRLFKCIFLSNFCNCLQKWMATLDASVKKGKQDNYSSICNMIFIVGNAAWYSVVEMWKTKLKMFIRKPVNLKKLKFFLLRPDSWPRRPLETLSSLNDFMIIWHSQKVFFFTWNSYSNRGKTVSWAKHYNTTLLDT